MNWKQEATEKLQRYTQMQQAAHNIPEELEMLEAAICAIRSARVDGAAGKGGGNKREDMLLNNIVKRQELTQTLTQTKQWLGTADRALRTLTPEERLVLQRMFILPEKGCVSRLCQELGIEQSSVYRKRDQALERFTRSLYGALETN